jgi:outer membrane protein assembly factor BamD
MLGKVIRHITAIAFLAMTISSCSEYQAILKSNDKELWYKKGMEYFNSGDFLRAANLLGPLVTPYTNSSKGDTIVMTYAKSLMLIGDYYSASHYFQNYVKTYPSSENCEECQFLCGKCFYEMSPKILLDQTYTENAINEFQTFINIYPGSDKVAEAETLMKEMQDKLAYKSYLTAKLYFDLGDYMGNNYRSAVIVAQNCLKKYPDTKHREELSFLILEAKYIQAVNSVLDKQGERYREAIDEYYAFTNEFPASKFADKAKGMLNSSQKGLKYVESVLPPSEDDLEYYRNFGTRAEKERLEAIQRIEEKK